jgi:Predicted hydrolases of HD superfamily
MDQKLEKQLQFLTEADKMKSVYRQTLIMDGSRRENDAEHSWHLALMALTLSEYAASDKVDINRVIEMALLHDLVEVYAGDTFCYDAKGYLDKDERERLAADKLFALLPKEQAAEFRGLWEEFDKMETPDSLYASAIDRFQPFLCNSKTGGHTWVLHKIKAEQVYKRMEPVRTTIPALWSFIEDVIAEYKAKGVL